MSPITRHPSRAGFTLVELLVTVLVGGLFLTAFTAFYLAQQRTFGRQRAEIESSQGLRAALEQMSRDLRSAGCDPTGTANAGITYADGTEVDFTLDANSDGVVTANDVNETKRFRRNGTTLESYRADQAAPWTPLADFAQSTGPIFSYYRCDGSQITTLPASAADRAAVARIDISLTVARTGGISLARTEAESMQIRNKVCP